LHFDRKWLPGLALLLTAGCNVHLVATRWADAGGERPTAPAEPDAGPTANDAGEPPLVGGLSLLTDTNRDGVVDDKDTAGLTGWSWKGSGAFLIANLDDDDSKGATDASDEIVNGVADEKDLAPIVLNLSAEAMARATSIVASVTAGAAETHLFEKTSTGWALVRGALGAIASHIELGIEAVRFADADWDGFVTLEVEVQGPKQAVVASQRVVMRVAPWIMLPNSAKTELLYVSSLTSRLRPDLDRALGSAGLPNARASSPADQDIWFQDTMEIGYTQLPGRTAMHVVMNGQRSNASDAVAITLLGPDFGYVSVGSPRQMADGRDYWMDWMSNLDVTHPVPEYPLGRIYYGRSDRTTFHPTIVKFLEAQEVQKPFSVYVEWLLAQQVDEVMTFVPDQNGQAKMLIASPAEAGIVLGSGYDAGNQQIQKYLDDDIALVKSELGLADTDIMRMPALFEGGGMDWDSSWSNPATTLFLNGALLAGATGVPPPVKADIEKKLATIGIHVAWVDDSEYVPWGGGGVHSATNASRTPLCASFVDCLP
jgi:protein-arginine deiminase